MKNKEKKKGEIVLKKIDKRVEKQDTDFLESELYQFCSNNFLLIYSIISTLTIICLGIQLFAQKTNLIMGMVPIFLILLYYMLFRYETTPTKQKIGYVLFRLDIATSTLVLINHFLLDYFNSEFENPGVFLFYGLLAFNVLLFGAYLLASTQRPINETFDQINELNIKERLEEMKAENIEIDPEDAILGTRIDPETNRLLNKPVVLPAKDRFLHMLIIGPTGCGKTSQTIIPMIWRDINNNNRINGGPLGITVLEPKGDLAEKVYAMVNYKNKLIDEAIENGTYNEAEYGIKRKVLYFNPILNNCPYFNPLTGNEDDVIENMCTTFNMLNADSPQYFKDMTDGLVRRSVKLLKRLLGDDATLLDLNTLVWNVNDEGRKNYVMKMKTLKTMPDGSEIRPDIRRENDELIDWFLNDYYAGIGGAKGAPKTYENTSGVRTQISKLVSNTYLKKVLNPPKPGDPGYEESLKIERINFDEALEKGYVITMSTCQGKLRDLGRFLGYFIILQLQASVFRRPGNENNRTHNMLYIDEFQVYSNPGFADMLTQGRSYRVASHLATQARAQIGMGSGRDGKAFIQLVSTNARNKIVYPGVSYEDAQYYADEFGQDLITKKEVSYRKKLLFNTPDDIAMSEAVREKEEYRFSPTDIMDRKFGEITYRIVAHNSVQPPGVSKISYIPADINKILDRMIEEDNNRRAINSADLAVVKNVSDEELTTEASKVLDPMAAYESAMTPMEDDFDLDGIESLTFDFNEPVHTKPKKHLFDDDFEATDGFSSTGSPFPEKPSIKAPPRSMVSKPSVSIVSTDIDDFIDLD